jgi:hypothetical protein
MLKDVRHCLAEAEAAGVPFSLADEAERLYAEADSGGRGGQDFAAVAAVADLAAGLGENPLAERLRRCETDSRRAESSNSG